MRVDITNGYVITSDALNYVLNKQTVVQKGSNQGQPCLEALGFHPTLGGLAKSLINKMVRGSTVESIEQLEQRMEEIAKEFESAILIQDGKESPAHVQTVGC